MSRSSLCSSWLELAHRTAIVTGAASGIGACVARNLASHGCNVLLVDKNKSTLKDSSADVATAAKHFLSAACGGAAACGTPGILPIVRSITCDVSEWTSVGLMMKSADGLASDAADVAASSSLTRLPPPVASILVNCAGITRDALLPNMSVEDFDSVLDVNLRGSWLVSRHFCDVERLRSLSGYRREMNEAGRSNIGEQGNSRITGRTVASIVNIGSVVSRSGNVGQTNYAASKGGVVGLTRALAKEMARHGIRANCVLPGFIETPMSRAVPEKLLERIQAKIPCEELGLPEDIANLSLFLCSEVRSGYITGECIECSGMIAL